MHVKRLFQYVMASVMLTSTLLVPVAVHANPIIPTVLKGKVYITENGLLYTKPAGIRFSCQDMRYGAPTASGEMPEPKLHWSYSEQVPCFRGVCSIDTILEGASCNLEVWTIEEHRLTFDHITFDHIDPSGYPGSDLGLEVDIARRTWDASPTYLPPTAPPNITKFLTALLLTWLIEVPVLFVVARTILKPRYTDTKRLLLAGIVASLITLPCAWYVLPFILVVVPVGFYIGTVETLVIVAEAWMYTRFLPLRMKQTLPVSILANVLSFLVGLLLL